MADFNVDSLIAEVTGGADSTSTVRVADGAVSQAKGKSGVMGR